MHAGGVGNNVSAVLGARAALFGICLLAEP